MGRRRQVINLCEIVTQAHRLSGCFDSAFSVNAWADPRTKCHVKMCPVGSVNDSMFLCNNFGPALGRQRKASMHGMGVSVAVRWLSSSLWVKC
jgi:hypothetical protein